MSDQLPDPTPETPTSPSQNEATPRAIESLPEHAPTPSQGVELLPDSILEPIALSRPRGIAPIWHTLLLVIAILAYSYWGSERFSSSLADHADRDRATMRAHPPGKPQAEEKPRTSSVRLIRYGLSVGLEVLILAWIALGLRLRKIPFRSLFGAMPRGVNNITLEFLIAGLFWICSMIVLLTVALTWQVVQDRIYQREVQSQHANPSAKQEQGADGQPDAKSGSKGAELKSPRKQQAEMVKKLMELAPATSVEVAAWALLCLAVGFCEELIFRGYLQSQSIAFLRNVPIAVLFTALIFGLAHGYQGLRGMCLITVYGALFSCIRLLRRNLLPGMIAHSWHDFATGMALALIRSSHLLDHAPFS